MRPIIAKAYYYRPDGGRRHGLEAARGHLRYMTNPKKEELVTDAQAMREQGTDEAAIHAKYMTERPGSQGLFGADRKHPPDEAALLREIGNHQGPVWRLFVSVHEDDARAMGGMLLRRRAFEDACRAVIPKMAAEMGIATNQIRWAAAMHRKEGHPHVHILLWSADPAKGFLSKQGLDAAKRAWASTLYAPERQLLTTEKGALRGQITSGAKDLLQASLTRRERDSLGDRLADIAQSLPGHGRLAYAFMPAEVRAKLDDAADYLLRSSPELEQAARRFGDIAAEIATHYSTDPGKHDEARQKAIADLRQRLGGALLRSAVTLEEKVAWRATSDSVFEAARVHPRRTATSAVAQVNEEQAQEALSQAIQPHVRAAVSRLARHPAQDAARAEARALLDLPDVLRVAEPTLSRAEQRAQISARTVSAHFGAGHRNDHPHLAALRQIVAQAQRDAAAQEARPDDPSASISSQAPAWAQAAAVDPDTPPWFGRYLEAVTWSDGTAGAWAKWLPATQDPSTATDAHRVLGGLIRGTIGESAAPSRAAVDRYVRSLASSETQGATRRAPVSDLARDAARMFAAVVRADGEEQREAALDGVTRWAQDVLRSAGVISTPPPPAPAPAWAKALADDAATPAWFGAYIGAADWSPHTVGAWAKWLPATLEAHQAQQAHRTLGGIVRGVVGDTAPSYADVDAYVRTLAESRPTLRSREPAPPPPLDEAGLALRAALLPEIGRLQASAAGDAHARALERVERRIAGTLLRSAEYLRDARAYRAAAATQGLARALQATVRQAEREAELAEARALEEEAARKRRDADQAERA